MSNFRQNYLPFFMWLLPLSFFTYQFILRLWPGLMMQSIMAQFSIDASHFGLLAAVYYYGYAGMQIPLALLLERFSLQKLIFSFALLCGLATFVFSFTHLWYLALLSRLLIGAGSAIGFLAVSKVISQWFSPDNYGRMVGLSFTLGLMGAIYGGKPVSLLIQEYPWQKVAMALSLVAILLGIFCLFFLKKPQKTATLQTQPLRLADFKLLFSSPMIWLLAIANALMVGSLEGFADVWAVPYLMSAYHLTKANAAQLVSFIFVGMLFGGPLLAWLSKRFSNYGVISFCGLGMALIFMLLLSQQFYNWYGFAALFIAVGIFCCYQVIVFSAGASLVRKEQLGVTVAFLNCINMLGGSFFHSLIGKLMDHSWTGLSTKTGLRIYSPDSYISALQLIPYSALIGVVIIAILGIARHKRKLRSSE